MAQLVARLVRNEKVGGSNPPSSTTGRHLIADVGFLYAWVRWCGACRCVACGAAGVPGAVGPGRPRDRHTRASLGVVDLEARPCPPGPPAPSTLAAPGVLMVFEARPGPATARGHRSLPHTPASYTPAAPAVLCVLAPVSKPARALRTLRCPPRQWCLAADVWLGASARSAAWSCRWPRAPQPGPTAAHRCGR